MSDDKVEELKPGKSPRETILARIKQEKVKGKTDELQKAMKEFMAADEVRNKALEKVIGIEEEIREINKISPDFT